MNEACNGTFFWPRPLGPGGEAKRSNIIKFQLQSQFQRFFNQTLCVFSHMKYIKHIKRDFSFGRLGHAPEVGLGGTVGGVERSIFYFFSKFIHIWCVSYLHEWYMHRHHFWVPTPWGHGEGSKGQISFNLNYKVNFKDF